MMTLESITTCLASDIVTWKAAREFLSNAYQEAFGLEPSDPDFLFCASHQGEVVGTLGLILPRNKSLAILSRHQVLSGMDAGGVEFGRWSSCHEAVSFALIRAATAFAISIGAKRGWCEQSPAVHRRTKRLGIALTPAPGATLDYRHVEPRHETYYRSTAVGLYWFDLTQTVSALHKYGERKFSLRD